MVRFEIDRITNGYVVSYLVTRKSAFSKVYFENLNDCIKLLQSFVEKNDLKKEYKVRMGNSENPKHPYDRAEKFWDEQSLQHEVLSKLRED